jgi:hypothetical protein
MSANIDLGYSLTLFDISTYYYLNTLLPKVSILDIFTSGSKVYYPTLPSDYTANAAGVSGWDWNIDKNGAWSSDPYFKFNLGDFVNNNIEGFSIPTSGSFIAYDFFAEAKEYM